MLFRRALCSESTQAIELHGLDPNAKYEVEFEDTGKTMVEIGSELSSLRVDIPSAPGAVIIFYRKTT